MPVDTDCVETAAEVTDDELVSAPQFVVPSVVVPDDAVRFPEQATLPVSELVPETVRFLAALLSPSTLTLDASRTEPPVLS